MPTVRCIEDFSTCGRYFELIQSCGRKREDLSIWSTACGYLRNEKLIWSPRPRFRWKRASMSGKNGWRATLKMLPATRAHTHTETHTHTHIYIYLCVCVRATLLPKDVGGISAQKAGGWSRPVELHLTQYIYIHTQAHTHTLTHTHTHTFGFDTRLRACRLHLSISPT